MKKIMPQFDIILYITFFFNFIIYGFLFYLLITLIILPFFFNIFTKRFFKKEINMFFYFFFKSYLKILQLEKLFKFINFNFRMYKNNKISLTYIRKLLFLSYILKNGNKDKFSKSSKD